jgi:hypothetical protein
MKKKYLDRNLYVKPLKGLYKKKGGKFVDSLNFGFFSLTETETGLLHNVGQNNGK